jgi:hypothetical protein
MNLNLKQKLVNIFINKRFIYVVLSSLILVVIAKAPVSIDFTYVDKTLFMLISTFFTLYCFDKWEDSCK